MAELTNQAVLESLQQKFGEQTFTDVGEPYGLLTVTTPREHDNPDPGISAREMSFYK
jgi:hypothetical protein